MFRIRNARKRRLLQQSVQSLRGEVRTRCEHSEERYAFAIEYDFLNGLTDVQAMHLLARMILQCEDLRSEQLIFRLKSGKINFIVEGVEYDFLVSQVAEVVDIARALLGAVEWTTRESGSIRIGKGPDACKLTVSVDLQDKWEIVVTIEQSGAAMPGATRHSKDGETNPLY